jgi:hypothetical protein
MFYEPKKVAKMVVATFLFLILFSIFSPRLFGQNWGRDYDFELTILETWGLQLEVWVDEPRGFINFIDNNAETWDDAYFQVSELMALFDVIFENGASAFSESYIELLVYSWFEGGERIDIEMPRDWLMQYFSANYSKAKYRMIEDLIDYYYDMYRPQTEQFAW